MKTNSKLKLGMIKCMGWQCIYTAYYISAFVLFQMTLTAQTPPSLITELGFGVGRFDYTLGTDPLMDARQLHSLINTWSSFKSDVKIATKIEQLSLNTLNKRSVAETIHKNLFACLKHLQEHDQKKESDERTKDDVGPNWKKLRVDIHVAQKILQEAPGVILEAEKKLEWLQAQERQKEYKAKSDFDRSKPLPTRVVTSRITPVRLKRGLEEDFTVRGKDLLAAVFTAKSGFRVPYRLFLPQGTKPAQSLPLVIFIHGNGSEAGTDNIGQFKHSQMLFFAQPASQKKNPCALLVPQFPKGVVLNGDCMGKEITPEAQAVIELIESLEKEHPELNPKRRYGIGLSFGGAGLMEMAVCRPNLLAAVVGLSNMGIQQIPENANLRTGFWFFYDEKENEHLISTGGDFLKRAARYGCQARMTLALAQKGHESWHWALFLPELSNWMFNQKLP